jgi:hypothetical protein
MRALQGLPPMRIMQITLYLPQLGVILTMNTSSKMEHFDVLRVKLEVLRHEHRDLDDAIDALQERRSADMLTLRRLKKQKLALKDKISSLEDRITPDIIA